MSKAKRIEITNDEYIFNRVAITNKLMRCSLRTHEELRKAINKLPQYLRYYINQGSIKVYYNDVLASSY